MGDINDHGKARCQIDGSTYAHLRKAPFLSCKVFHQQTFRSGRKRELTTHLAEAESSAERIHQVHKRLTWREMRPAKAAGILVPADAGETRVE